MIRTLGGIVAGMAAAITLIMITEAIGNQVAPAPARLDFTGLTDTQPLPILTSLFPVFGWLLGAMIGGFIAIKVSDRTWTAWVISGAVLAAAIFNFVLMVFPVWVMIAGVFMPLIGGWLAQRICAMASNNG